MPTGLAAETVQSLVLDLGSVGGVESVLQRKGLNSTRRACEKLFPCHGSINVIIRSTHSTVSPSHRARIRFTTGSCHKKCNFVSHHGVIHKFMRKIFWR